MWPFPKKKKDNLHALRSKAIALLADEPDIAKKEVIESLIAEYFPKQHLHGNPRPRYSDKDFNLDKTISGILRS